MTPALSLYLLAAARGRAADGAARAAMWSPTGADARGGVRRARWSGSTSPRASRRTPPRCSPRASPTSGPRTGFVVTSDDPAGAEDELPWLPRPADFPEAVDAFLAAWAPNAGVWIGGPIWPVAGRQGAAGRRADAARQRDRGPRRASTGAFPRATCSASSAASSPAAEDDGRGARPRACAGRSPPSGGCSASTRPLDHDERERQRLTAALQTRPVWFAGARPSPSSRPCAARSRRARAPRTGCC